MDMRTVLVRGMLTGLAAAALALVFARIFGEPQLGHGIAFQAVGFALGTYHVNLTVAALVISAVSVALSLTGLELGARSAPGPISAGNSSTA